MAKKFLLLLEKWMLQVFYPHDHQQQASRRDAVLRYHPATQQTSLWEVFGKRASQY
jgi:hypothetical protein